MKIEVKRITPIDLWRECAEMTTGKPCRMSWLDMLKTGHSPIREQRYLIKWYDVQQFVCGHLIRHDKFANPFVQSKRIDRGGEDFRDVCNELANEIINLPHVASEVAEAVIEGIAENVRGLQLKFDRYAPASFSLDANAEEIIAISRARLCSKASKETRDIWRQTLDLLEEIDPDLVQMCKRPCVWNGFCREQKPCGYMASDAYKAERKSFKEMFKPKAL